MNSNKPSVPAYVAAAGVHVYTASGVVLAFLTVLAAIQKEVTLALWLGLVAMVIDGTDGMLARTFRVKERLPWFDGATLDNIVDYLTYVFAPVVLLWTCSYLPQGPAGLIIAVLPLLASAYQFCRVDAKTDDHFFLGFPSYWNVVAFYVIVLGLNPQTTSIALIVLAVLAFVPICYLYPSRTLVLRRLTLAASAIWMICSIIILLGMPAPDPLVVNISLLFVAYYVAASLYLTYRRYLNRREQRSHGSV
jgi:phosphatidylcholine synthase